MEDPEEGPAPAVARAVFSAWAYVVAAFAGAGVFFAVIVIVLGARLAAEGPRTWEDDFVRDLGWGVGTLSALLFVLFIAIARRQRRPPD